MWACVKKYGCALLNTWRGLGCGVMVAFKKSGGNSAPMRACFVIGRVPKQGEVETWRRCACVFLSVRSRRSSIDTPVRTAVRSRPVFRSAWESCRFFQLGRFAFQRGSAHMKTLAAHHLTAALAFFWGASRFYSERARVLYVRVAAMDSRHASRKLQCLNAPPRDALLFCR